MAALNSSGESTLDVAAARLLKLLTALFVVVTLACFAQSYRQLFDWATTHRVPMWQAWAWPAGVDAPIVMGEILLFVAIVRGWPLYVKMLGGLVALGGFAASLAANVGFLPSSATINDRLTAGLAPLVASISLGIALVALKYVTRASDDADSAGAVLERSKQADHSPPPRARRPVDEVARQRSKGRVALALDSAEADSARAAISVATQTGGPPPSAYALGLHYLGGDPATGRRGNERLAKQLLDEARA